MTLKTLILGSAAAILMVGGAQAADLGAEPASYVKVCDAFGAGYWYAPGTDTCIKISGWARLDVNLAEFTSPVTHVFGIYDQLGVTAASLTEYGPMIANIVLEMGTAGVGPGPAPAPFGTFIGIDAATLSLGPFSAGYAWTSYSGGADWGALFNISGIAYTGATHSNFLQLSWASSGVGAWVALEDYRPRSNGAFTGAIPDITGGLSFGGGPFSVSAAFGYGDRTVTDTYGAKVNVSAGLGGLGNLTVVGAYSANTSEWVNVGAAAPGSWWSVYAALTGNLSSQVTGTLAGAWQDTNDFAGVGQSDVWANLSFYPVKNFQIGAEVNYHMPEVGANSVSGVVRFQRSFP